MSYPYCSRSVYHLAYKGLMKNWLGFCVKADDAKSDVLGREEKTEGGSKDCGERNVACQRAAWGKLVASRVPGMLIRD